MHLKRHIIFKELNVLTVRILFAFIVVFTFESNAQSSAQVVPGSYLVKFKNVETINSVHQKISQKFSLKGAFPNPQLYQLKINEGESENIAVREMAQNPDVEYIEPDYILSIDPTTEKSKDSKSNSDENSALVSNGGFNISSLFTEWAGDYNAVTSSAQAYLVRTPSKVPIVAVIDTGLDKTHPVISGSNALWVNTYELNGQAGVDDDGNGYVDDFNGWNFMSGTNNFADDDDHGTHVSGIVLGTGINIFSDPISQAKVKIMPLKFIGPSGGSTANAVRAVYYAINMGADVINNSWGGGNYSQSLHEALSSAYAHRLTIVSAAGNDGKSIDSSPMYPAAYDVPSNIAVAALNDFDSNFVSEGTFLNTKASFSNYGSRVSIGAPGVDVFSTVPVKSGSATIFKYKSGTSMAAPYVAGLIAHALRETNSQQLTGYQLKTYLLQSAKAEAYLTNFINGGKRIDPSAFIQLVQNNANVNASQPNYSPDYLEETTQSSTTQTKQKSMGCGAITSFIEGSNSGGGISQFLMLIVLFSLPLVVWKVLKMKIANSGVSGRQFPRFKIKTDLQVKVGDRTMIAQMNSVGVGGLGFNVDEVLEKGGVVKLSIQSPDGKEVFEVEGKVVWAEDRKSYGVQFSEVQSNLLSKLQGWSLLAPNNKA